MQLPFSSSTKPNNEPAAQAGLTLTDVIAPREIEVDFGHIRINNLLFKSFFVSNYPRYIEPNWLEPLIDFDHSLDIGMHIYPSNSKTVLDDLRRKIAEMEATIQTDLERGHAVNPSVQIALDDARDLQEQLAKGAERFFRLGLYVTVPADSKEELTNTSKLVESTLASLSITARETTLQMEDSFISTLPLGLDLLNLNHNMDTTSLATTFPFTTSELTSNEGIMYGINEHNDSLVVFDRFSLENANSVVFAKSGAGKSVCGSEPVLIQDNQETRLLPIGELVDKLIVKRGINFRDEELEGVAEPNIKVMAFDQNLKAKWSNVTIAARKDSPNKLFAFETASGRKITVTEDHNLVILRDGRVVMSKPAGIKDGDVVPIPRCLPEPTASEYVLNIADILKNAGAKYTKFMSKQRSGYRIGSKLRQLQTSLPLKLSVSPKFAKLLGFITSEGWVGSYTTISNLDADVLEETKAALNEIGLSFFEIKGINQQTKQININSRTFSQLIKALGGGGRSGHKRVPGFLFNCSNQIIASYLKAYFEGDGTVEKHGVSYTTKSSQLASDIAYLLLRFGIIARIRNIKKRATNINGSTKQDYYSVVISGQSSIEKYLQEIGFISERKQQRLQALIGGSENTNVDTIPGIENLLKPIFTTLYDSPYQSSPKNFSPLKRGVFSPSPTTLKSLLKEFDQRIDHILTVTSSRIRYLKNLPHLSLLIESGRLIPQVNALLWQELGESWRLAKNGTVEVSIGNALRANQVIFGDIYDFEQIKEEIILAFAELGLSLEEYDPSLWNYLRYRHSTRGSYARILKAVDYLDQKFQQKTQNINEIQVQIKLLKNLAWADLFWDPITKIQETTSTDKYVYDLTVDEQVFLAGKGGMFIHNSYFVKLEAIRSMMFGTQIIVIDPEREYLKLTQALGGSYVNFASDSPVKINPFDLSTLAREGENELGEKILSLTGFLKLVLGPLNASQSAILDRALTTTYRLKGITADPKTQTLPPPLMEDLYKVLLGMEDPNSQDMAFRLERFIKGSLSGIFSAPTNISIQNQLTAFSVRDLPEELRPLAMYLIIDYIWTTVRRDFRKRILIVDEAWYMMKNPDSANFLTEIAKRARKYYLGLTTITTDVEDFLAGDHGKEIISNSSIQVLFKQSPASIDQIGQMFYLSDGEKRLLLSAGVGQGLFFAGPSHVAIGVVASPLEHQLITTNPKEIAGT